MLGYFARLGNTQRRLRGTLFSREHWGNFLRSLPWVVPLTLLIWIYAEREQLADEPKVTIPIDVRTSDPNRYVTLVSPREKNIMAELTGPRAALEKVKERLAPHGDAAAIQIDVDPPISAGEHELFTAQIQNNPIFKDAGITVTNCQPSLLRVFVDQVEEREFTVKAPPAVAANLEQSPTFEPAKVKVRGPVAVLDNAPDRIIYANFSGLDSVLRTPGQHEEPAVPLTPPFKDGDHVTINPKTVRAFLKVKEADVTLKLDYVPIYNLDPQGLLAKHKVTFPAGTTPTLSNVTVIGPKDQIDVLKDPKHEPKPVAVLRLNREDADGKLHERTLLILGLPDGVTPIPEDANRKIEFKLDDLTAAE
jgi:hypothetical protein